MCCVPCVCARVWADYALLEYTPSQVGAACFSVAANYRCSPLWTRAVFATVGCVPEPPAPLMAALEAVFAPVTMVDPRKSPEAITHV